ncbi:FAD-binding domain-containing protein [Lophiostoma macrostomum CBS 122681]|uniref:FAD-binding domain-containing protein n=1 Tax=Lophiostoma macrostomum CBS 122681 TaxID=1314788 RepID=A0A6A6STE2_9PLEO|nr:FAD-binding domain-containing protein [Lophiostoma macrostomum CBS 122681]
MAALSCCALLAQTLGSNLAFPNTTAYETTVSSYWSLQEVSLHPSCVLRPSSTNDLSTAVPILTSNKCTFAIKSHGHAPAAGFANINDGVTIDLTSLKTVSLSADKSVAHVDPGLSWFEVYSYLDKFNVTVAGGRNGAVGVGGLTLGGGISYIGPRVGWTSDTVLNFEVVLGSGEIANANATHHADLFRALKGGSNNFGIVSSISFRTYAQGEILAGNIISPFSQLPAVADAFAKLANATPYDPYAELVTSVAWTAAAGWGNFTHIAAYTKPETKPAALQPLLDVANSTNTLHITPISTWSNESANPLTERLFYTGTYGVSAVLLQDIVHRWDAILNSTAPIPGLIAWGFTFEPLPTVFTAHYKDNGGNPLGVTDEQGNMMVLLLSPVWNNTASDTLVVERAESLLAAADQAAKELGLLKRFRYLNYAAPGQEPLRSYGKKNFAALTEVSRKYDPNGVFQKLVPGGFKLWD